MEGTIIFSNDGVLRFQSSSDESVIVPLISIQEALKASSTRFFLQNITKRALLEKGSTVGSFIMCLSPWSEVAGDIFDRDVSAYVAEVRKPSSIDNVFDRIEMKKLMYITRDLDYGDMPDDIDFLEWLNTPKEPILLDTFNMDVQMDICGYTDGDTSNYSLTGTSIQELKNVPLILNRITTLIEHNKGVYADKGTVIDHNVSGVKQYDYMNYLESKNDTAFTLYELISTVFCDGLFFSTPKGAAHAREMLKESVEANKEMNELDKDKIPDLREVNEDGSLEGKQMEIKIADGAFEPIINHYNEEKKEWSAIMSKIDSDSRYPIRIGKVEEELPKDRRLRGALLDQEPKVDE